MFKKVILNEYIKYILGNLIGNIGIMQISKFLPKISSYLRTQDNQFDNTGLEEYSRNIGKLKYVREVYLYDHDSNNNNNNISITI